MLNFAPLDEAYSQPLTVPQNKRRRRHHREDHESNSEYADAPAIAESPARTDVPCLLYTSDAADE